jgi:hypothetical protein
MHNSFKFEVIEKDIDYAKYLIESYKRFVSYVYQNHLKEIDIIDTDKIRGIYFFIGMGIFGQSQFSIPKMLELLKYIIQRKFFMILGL